ncbi:hypothetical protein [Companilactobacillus zhongbaensis]|uniref:hypothetical protein n=1 Tax=Companilactobacillus zhongbaensis TaxID=2486009 RepID=UPI000F77CC89|nr:hypothetical protein [Companilactobacillus zhongbaensis]
MNKVILDDFIAEFNKKYNAKTFSSLEVINNDSLDQSSIFIKQTDSSDDQLKQIYSISPMNTKSVNVILSEASKLLPFDGYYLHTKSPEKNADFVKLS